MRIIATDDDFRRAAEKVLLRAEDMVQEIDTEGHLLNQWSLRISPDLKNVGPESMKVLRQLNQKICTLACIYSSAADPRQGPWNCRQMQPRRTTLHPATRSEMDLAFEGYCCSESDDHNGDNAKARIFQTFHERAPPTPTRPCDY